MPSVEQNYEVWNREYGWSQQGDEWSGPWGLQCISQETVNWRTRRLIDCFSVFTRQGSRVARPNHVSANPGFMAEVAMAARLSSLYVLDTSSARKRR